MVTSGRRSEPSGAATRRTGRRVPREEGEEMKYWLLLFLAGILQTVWIIALRQTQGFTRFGPIVVYAAVGLATTVCLSRSFEGIPVSTAYTVWMGVSILGSAVIDMAASRSLDLTRVVCILLILGGAVGLKLAEKPEPAKAPGRITESAASSGPSENREIEQGR